MKCLFCGSEDLKTVQTHSKNEFIQANKIGSRDDGTGGIEVFSEPFELSVTRRKMRCNNCKQHFWSVEHFEKSTLASQPQLALITNLTLVNNSPVVNCNLTEEDKERLNKLLQEE